MKKDLEFKILASIAFLSPFLMCGEEWMLKVVAIGVDNVLVRGYTFLSLPVVGCVALFLALVWCGFFSKKVIMSAGAVLNFSIIMLILNMTYHNNFKYMKNFPFAALCKQIQRCFFQPFYMSFCLFVIVFIGFLLGAIYTEKSRKTIDI